MVLTTDSGPHRTFPDQILTGLQLELVASRRGLPGHQDVSVLLVGVHGERPQRMSENYFLATLTWTDSGTGRNIQLVRRAPHLLICLH
jgi:hypothetical protein